MWGTKHLTRHLTKNNLINAISGGTTCVFCLDSNGKNNCCDNCRAAMPVITRSCRLCALPMEYSLTGQSPNANSTSMPPTSTPNLPNPNLPNSNLPNSNLPSPNLPNPSTNPNSPNLPNYSKPNSPTVPNSPTSAYAAENAGKAEKHSDNLCSACYLNPPPLSMAWAPYAYFPPLSKALHHLKFNNLIYYANILGNLWLEAYINNLLTNSQEAAHSPNAYILNSPPDLILPMPLHKNKLRERGFNQVVELIKPLASFLGLPINSAKHSICHRIKATVPQYNLTLQQRRKNLTGAFALNNTTRGIKGGRIKEERIEGVEIKEINARAKRPLQGKNILIIDDVITSTTTVHELAHTLKRGGANQVAAWSLLRA